MWTWTLILQIIWKHRQSKRSAFSLIAWKHSSMIIGEKEIFCIRGDTSSGVIFFGLMFSFFRSTYNQVYGEQVCTLTSVYKPNIESTLKSCIARWIGVLRAVKLTIILFAISLYWQNVDCGMFVCLYRRWRDGILLHPRSWLYPPVQYGHMRLECKKM